MLFPHEKIREIQKDMLDKVDYAVSNKKKIIVHAPTGLGKTAASLSPALEYALKNNLTIFFLTSRHTQHRIVIDTLKKIKEKVDFSAADIIGKKYMCCQDNVEDLYSNEFSDYCKTIREKGECEFYNNLKKKNKLTVEAKVILDKLKNKINHTEELIEECKYNKLCPYEIAVKLAKKSKVIIADYYYIFSPSIRDVFFRKINKKIEECILIIDEGHNLGNRVRNLMSVKLSNFMLKRAIKEAKKFNPGIISNLSMIQDILNEFCSNIKEEKLINKIDFIKEINKIKNYNELTAELDFIGDIVREQKKKSYVGSIANFLEAWQNQDEGFARILSLSDYKKMPLITLSYRCLDPSLITKDIINNSYSTIIMSGTLTPTKMHRDLLGFPDEIGYEFKSPFPIKNRLNLIITETTTKFTERNENEYRKIAVIINNIFNAIKGNTAVFFPSYQLRDYVYFFFKKYKNKVILEKSKLNKENKQKLLEKFKKHKDKGAILLGVTSGSFGEGIDLPGDLLKCVIVVGLPLTKPDLETKELIKYYNNKFGKGMDYGYIMPAMTKAMQNAGRCIRSEEDKGVIVFLDKRYLWPVYNKYFPKDWDVKIGRDYVGEIKDFRIN